MKITELPAIKETTEDYEAIEKAIRDHFKRELYLPILRELGYGHDRLQNSKATPSLTDALLSGQVTFNRGEFSGKFNSEISKQLRAMGATFDRLTGTYRLLSKDLPLDIRQTISVSESKFQERLDRIGKKMDDVLSKMGAEKGLSKKLGIDRMFDRTIFRVDKDFQKNVRNITVAPRLTPEQRKRISDEWGTNMDLWISDFSKKEVVELRQNMMQTIFAGDRYGSAIKTIQDSYGVTERKAKFLARQETGLLMAKFKETRYQAAGVDYYVWRCVTGSPAHPVRPYHKKNDGLVWRWDDPPTVDAAGNHKNPGQDYNCVPEGTLVSLHAPAVKAYRRWYDGELTSLIVDTHETVQTTPNHPVLTLRGWLPAHLVEVGDYLVQAPRKRLNPVVANPQGGDALAEEVFGALKQAGYFHRIAGRASRFHGDSAGEEVEVVTVKGMLSAKREPASDGSPPLFEAMDDDLLAQSVLSDPENFVLRKVRVVTRSTWSGYVHNFETTTGWYSAGNLIIHNCRCSARPLVGYSGRVGVKPKR